MQKIVEYSLAELLVTSHSNLTARKYLWVFTLEAQWSNEIPHYSEKSLFSQTSRMCNRSWLLYRLFVIGNVDVHYLWWFLGGRSKVLFPFPAGPPNLQYCLKYKLRISINSQHRIIVNPMAKVATWDYAEIHVSHSTF